MRKTGLIVLLVILLEVLLAVGSNFLFLHIQDSIDGREYRVEIERVSRQITRGDTPDLSGCRYVTGVELFLSAGMTNDEHKEHLKKYR